MTFSIRSIPIPKNRPFVYNRPIHQTPASVYTSVATRLRRTLEEMQVEFRSHSNEVIKDI